MKVLVTGASGGIGSAIVAELLEHSHEVVTQDIRSAPGREMTLEGDLNDPGHLAQLAQVCDDHGVDAVIAAHGIAAARPLSEVDRAYSDRVMRINTLSFINLLDAVSARLVASDGVFVAISSQAGLYGEADNGAYCASKFALLGWAEGLRSLPETPRVRILCPGATETPLLRQAFEGMAAGRGVDYETILAERSANIPAGRLGRPTDLAAAARWLSELPTPRHFVAAVTGGEVLH